MTLDRGRTMLDALPPMHHSEREVPNRPAGSFARAYAIVIVIAMLMMAVLWLLTATYNIRLGSA
ncbi:MAG: hypothetical protein KDC98_09595 [Planctomycetes bacterium]|nr:hypothetical protein [Planctomycetota bacterium]